MKKITLLLTTLLVLMSSIVFSACGNNYKKLKIESDVEEVELVIGADVELSRALIDFEISGVKSWGEVDINSSPVGLVRVDYEIDGKHCYVGVEALQPAEKGAQLTIKHLGSGKSLSLPLKIGEKLKSVSSTGNEYIVSIPEKVDGKDISKDIEIDVKDVLTFDPINYSDKIVWLPNVSGNNSNQSHTGITGVEIINYMKDGDTTNAIFNSTETGEKDKYNGTSEVVRSEIRVSSRTNNGAELKLHPVTVVDGEAVLHKDIEIVVKFVKLLQPSDIRVDSPTHNVVEEEGEPESMQLGDLVLITNPTSIRTLNGLATDYNYYSTAIINLMYNEKLGADDYWTNLNDEDLQDIYDIYKLDISTDIDNLLIDVVDNGTFRITATSNCVGKGNVVINITPNKSAGDIQPIKLTIPCEVGEQATGIKANRLDETIEFKYDEYSKLYEGTAVLTDDNASYYGQRFNFEVLGVNTLSALKGYRLVIDKNLLYINPAYTDEMTNTNRYIKNGDGTDYDLSNFETNYPGNKYQIMFRKDGKEICFYHNENDGSGQTFISEPLSANNAIYIKYYIDNNNANERDDISINIVNYYNNKYNVENNYFGLTCIDYKLNFDRKRKVELVAFNPADAVRDGGGYTSREVGTEWQLYLTKEMLNDANYYGIYINEVLGINRSILTSSELSKIGLTMEVVKVDGGKSNIGVGLLSNLNEVTFTPSCSFNYLGDGNNSNFVAIGKPDNVDLKDIELGDYRLVISQYGVEITSVDVRIYKELQSEGIMISLPNAEFEGKDYLYNADDSEYLKNITGNSYIISTSSAENNKNYQISINVEDKEFVNYYDLDKEVSIISATENKGVINNYLTNYFSYNQLNDVITTGDVGSYNTITNENNYIKLSYTFKVDQYDYYQKKATTNDITKDVYIFVYEPITRARFNKSVVYKYNYHDFTIIDDIDGSILYENELADEYCKEDLTIQLNSESVFNYIQIQWFNGVRIPSGIESKYSKFDSNDKHATFVFGYKNLDETITGNINATITQYGVQVPIYCIYEVRKTVLTEQITLNNTTHSFKSGGNYLNLKDGEQLTIDAENYSSEGEVTAEGLKYFITNANGYLDNSVASVSDMGIITTKKAGRAKLIIVATDNLKKKLTEVINYTQFSSYVKYGAYLMVDLIVSDGSEENPYLLANITDLKGINNGLDKHYALINDINLTGEVINITGEFSGSIASYQESATANNRFGIYGLTLNKVNNNMYLFENLASGARIENIDFYMTFNYVVDNTQDILIGLVAENYGEINNITINVLGEIDGEGLASNIYVGSIAAKNYGTIKVDNTRLVGVQGSITIAGCTNAGVIVGGAVGENGVIKDVSGEIIQQGQIVGALKDENVGGSADDISYEVYYDAEGAMTNVTIQVKAANNDDNKSAIGGVIGKNFGTMDNVYSTGKLLGCDDSGTLHVDNVGGLIGYNVGAISSKVKVATTGVNNGTGIIRVDFSEQGEYQVVNCYSTMHIKARNNVGGAVGLDDKGLYKKVYYEIYDENTTVINGYNNVGGLVGKSTDGNFYYCYANSFVWGYKNSVITYELTGNTNVGGLIGCAQSTATTGNISNKGLHIASSAASITISASSHISGIIGRMDGFGAIYTAYYYGLIKGSANGVVKMYNNEIEDNQNTPYCNVYSIINSSISYNDVFDVNTSNLYDENAGFKLNPEYNNGYPYVVYGTVDVSLVSLVPTIITVKDAFYTNNDNLPITTDVVYVLENDMYMRYELQDGKYIRYEGNTKITLNDSLTKYGSYIYSTMFEKNPLGDYVLDTYGNYIVYKASDYESMPTRYILRADVARTDDTTSTDSDYRQDVLILYYYEFKSLTDSNASADMRNVNTFDMHKLLNDNGIKVQPNTYKRFKLYSSNDNVVTVLDNGKLLLRKEGTAIITLTSALNKNATASFVIIVRSKVLNFGLYSSANTFDEYNVEGKNINIVKNTSKIIYTDYSATIQADFNRVYDYESPTNIELDFEITVNNGELETGKISAYITLNGTNNGDNKYTISYNTPITISVHDYFNGKFEIIARPYIIVDYVNGKYTQKLRIELSDYFTTSFYVVTRKGVTSINTDSTYVEMMPSDESDVNVEIGADIKVNEVKIDIYAQDSDGNSGFEGKDYAAMLDFWYNNTNVNIAEIENREGYYAGTIDISDIEFEDNGEIQLQSFTLNIVPNQNSYYLSREFRVQIILTALDGDNLTQDIFTILNIVIKPQQISSIMALSYRNEEGIKDLENANNKLSNIIRPGSRNVLVIDVAPNIAVYDYMEIEDLSNQDAISFMQLDKELNSVSNGEISSSGKGIKLRKADYKTSTLYVSAILPITSQANIAHLIKITAYDEYGNVLKTTHISLEAVLYPTIIMTYTNPKGKATEVDTRKGAVNNTATADIDLAMGVEAGIKVEAINIDEETLTYSVNVKDNNEVEEALNDYVTFAIENNQYVLRFNANYNEDWEELLGKTIEVQFEASKSLNGFTESSIAKINFKVKRIVIHGVSITPANVKGTDILGNYNEVTKAQFYFGKNDISYYNANNRYWDTSYYTYTRISTTDEKLAADLTSITNILKSLNAPDGVKALVEYNNTQIKAGESYDFDNAKIKIINDKDNYCYYITASEISNINDSAFKATFKLNFDEYYRPILENAGNTTIKQTFNFNFIEPTSIFEEKKEITSVEQFLEMREGTFYELVVDLELDKYVPLSTNIGGLDGNGHTITIKNFNVTEMAGIYSDGVAYMGLFGTLGEDVLLENLKVNYTDTTIDLTQEILASGNSYTNVYFGGIAGLNLGVITNVSVNGTVDIIANQIVATNMYVGGIAGFNGGESSVKLATITNSTSSLKINSLALIGGITSTNNGKIANTIFNGQITCWKSGDYSSTIYTGGIAVYNHGSISLSGTMDNLDAYKDIQSVGNVGGFVAYNYGDISNSFVNQVNIEAQGEIGGFVYQSSGQITLSYAYAGLTNSRFYETFIKDVENYGTIKDCYVLGGSIGEQRGVKGLTRLEESQFTGADNYVGFLFSSKQNGEYGIWTMGDNAPQLQSAGFKSDYNVRNIYDVTTFEGRLHNYSGILMGQRFKIVRDIDLSTLLDNPKTHSMIFASQLEGNNMTISGYNIYNNGTVDNIGLFGSIQQDSEGKVYVRNLVLQPSSIRASGSRAVGGLAGEIDGANLYNITIDNSSLMILGKNSVGGVAGIIKGDFEIIGLYSNVSAFATYSSGGTTYNLYTGKNITNSEDDVNINNLSSVSYAGAIAGIINGYGQSSFNSSNRSDLTYMQVANIEVSQDVVLVGEVVGGAFGLVGERTLVNNINYLLNANTKFQASFIAGGLVGENRGIIINSSISKTEDTDNDTTDCFNYLTTDIGEGAVGGIVGLNIGGLVYNCSSNIDMYSSLDSTDVGGIVGRNIAGTISNCTVSGSLDGYFVGGIAAADYSYEVIEKVNSISNESLRVYKAVYGKVNYTLNGIGFESRYVDNTLTYEFINNFVSKQSKYYAFNSTYNATSEEKLVRTEKVFGLMVGISNEEFMFEELDNKTILLNNNGLVISVSNTTIDSNVECEVTYNEDTYSVSCIQNVVTNKIDIREGQNFTILYLVGYIDAAKYQDWNTALNYSNKYILTSTTSLIPVIEEPEV